MKKKLFLAVLGVGLCIGITACTTFQASGMQMGINTSGYEVLGTFSTTVHINKFLGQSGGTNFLNISSDATNSPIRNAIDREIARRGGTAAINISIKYGSNPIQWFLNYLTFSFWAPSTVTVSGTVIREN